MQLFAHKQLDPKTGTRLTADLLFVVADENGITPTYLDMVPVGITLIILYVVGIPALFGFCLWYYRKKVNRVEYPDVEARIGRFVCVYKAYECSAVRWSLRARQVFWSTSTEFTGGR